VEEQNGVVQEVRSLYTSGSEDVYDVAIGRAKQDGLVRGLYCPTVQYFPLTCTNAPRAMPASVLADNAITAALGTLSTAPTRRESEQVRICPSDQR